jgi:hypothetical protein
MKPSKPIEVTVNSIPAGQFTRFAWHKDGKFLLRLVRIDISYRETLVATAHYTYPLEIECHAGYVIATIHLFGKSWLVHFGKRSFYIERINKQAEE